MYPSHLFSVLVSVAVFSVSSQSLVIVGCWIVFFLDFWGRQLVVEVDYIDLTRLYDLALPCDWLPMVVTVCSNGLLIGCMLISPPVLFTAFACVVVIPYFIFLRLLRLLLLFCFPFTV
jgi:hypothetical protein